MVVFGRASIRGARVLRPSIRGASGSGMYGPGPLRDRLRQSLRCAIRPRLTGPRARLPAGGLLTPGPHTPDPHARAIATGARPCGPSLSFLRGDQHKSGPRGWPGVRWPRREEQTARNPPERGQFAQPEPARRPGAGWGHAFPAACRASRGQWSDLPESGPARERHGQWSPHSESGPGRPRASRGQWSAFPRRRPPASVAQAVVRIPESRDPAARERRAGSGPHSRESGSGHPRASNGRRFACERASGAERCPSTARFRRPTVRGHACGDGTRILAAAHDRPAPIRSSGQSALAREEPVPPAAREEPRGLVPVG